MAGAELEPAAAGSAPAGVGSGPQGVLAGVAPADGGFAYAPSREGADIVTMEQGLSTVRVAEACIESATTGRTVEIS